MIHVLYTAQLKVFIQCVCVCMWDSIEFIFWGSHGKICQFIFDLQRGNVICPPVLSFLTLNLNVNIVKSQFVNK